MGEYTDAAAKKEALRVINEAGLGPAPDTGLTHYSNEGTRQMALAHAARANIAHSATEDGVTTEQWEAKRKELGRSPTRSDFIKK